MFALHKKSQNKLREESSLPKQLKNKKKFSNIKNSCSETVEVSIFLLIGTKN